jgi:hypothetical protein
MKPSDMVTQFEIQNVVLSGLAEAGLITSSIGGAIVSLSPTLQISIHSSFKVKSLSKRTNTLNSVSNMLMDSCF